MSSWCMPWLTAGKGWRREVDSWRGTLFQWEGTIRTWLDSFIKKTSWGKLVVGVWFTYYTKQVNNPNAKTLLLIKFQITCASSRVIYLLEGLGRLAYVGISHHHHIVWSYHIVYQSSKAPSAKKTPTHLYRWCLLSSTMQCLNSIPYRYRTRTATQTMGWRWLDVFEKGGILFLHHVSLSSYKDVEMGQFLRMSCNYQHYFPTDFELWFQLCFLFS